MIITSVNVITFYNSLTNDYLFTIIVIVTQHYLITEMVKRYVQVAITLDSDDLLTKFSKTSHVPKSKAIIVLCERLEKLQEEVTELRAEKIISELKNDNSNN